MKKIITALFCTAFALSMTMTAYAAEALERDYIEAEIWEDIWNGKSDNGLDYPEASYKHHLLDQWITENYGSDDFDWNEIGELKYEYKRYYQELIEEWDFEDDDNGNWTIGTEDNHYSFTMLNDTWQMIDKNGNTVDSFPPFSTLEDEEDEPESTDSYEIQDDGEESPRVIGEVTGEAASGPDSAEVTEESSTPDSTKTEKGVNPVPITVGATLVGGVGVAGYLVNKKRRK